MSAECRLAAKVSLAFRMSGTSSMLDAYHVQLHEDTGREHGPLCVRRSIDRSSCRLRDEHARCKHSNADQLRSVFFHAGVPSAFDSEARNP